MKGVEKNKLKFVIHLRFISGFFQEKEPLVFPFDFSHLIREQSSPDKIGLNLLQSGALAEKGKVLKEKTQPFR